MTRPTPTPLPLAAVVCGAIALLAGCGGGDLAGPSDDETTAGAGADASAPSPGPLDEYLGRIYGYSTGTDPKDQAAQQTEVEQQLLRSEELVAACMREQGFDYTPDAEVTEAARPSDLDVAIGTREFAERYGYGISTDPWQQEDAADDAEDPDNDYRASMSESERAAYDEALWGVEQADGDVDDWTQAGCQGVAQHEIEASGQQDPGEFSALQDEVARFQGSVADDPRLTELNARWASCMAEEGYPDQTIPGLARYSLEPGWATLQGYDTAEYQAALEGWDWGAAPDGPPRDEPDPAAVDAFVADEIAMAVIDLDCQDQVDHAATSTTVDHQLQQEFVDLHRAELDAWAEQAESGRDQG